MDGVRWIAAQLGGGLGDHGIRQRLPNKRLLNSSCPNRCGPNPADRDPSLRANPVLDGDCGDGHDKREVPATKRQLLHRDSSSRDRETHGNKQFAGFQGSLMRAKEEITSRDVPGTVNALCLNGSVEGHGNRGQLSGWVGVRETASDRATVADGYVADVAERLGQQRQVLPDDRGGLGSPMPRHRPDHEIPIVPAQVGEVVQPADVHKKTRPGQAHVQQWDEALPTSEDFGVGIGQCLDGLGSRGCPQVFEGSGLHRLVPFRMGASIG